MDTVAYASLARRNGDNAQAGKILATGLATFFPIGVAATGDDTTSKPDAMHAHWQRRLDRCVAMLIGRVYEQLHYLSKGKLGPDFDVVYGGPSPDALLEAISKDGGIVAYRDALANAVQLNNEGRHDDALAALRTAPAHQAIMTYFAAPAGAPGSDKAYRALSTAHEALHAFQNLVNSDDDAPAGFLGQQVSYAREHPEVLRTRGLVQSVIAELFRVGAYRDVLGTAQPPVPPRIVAGSSPKS